MKRFTVDRIEGDKAILECENGETAVFELRSLPKNLKEGDILNFEQGSCYLNEKETEQRRQKMRDMMSKLFEDDSQQ